MLQWCSVGRATRQGSDSKRSIYIELFTSEIYIKKNTYLADNLTNEIYTEIVMFNKSL